MPRVQRQVDSRNETGERKGAHSLMTLVPRSTEVGWKGGGIKVAGIRMH